MKLIFIVFNSTLNNPYFKSMIDQNENQLIIFKFSYFELGEPG